MRELEPPVRIVPQLPRLPMADIDLEPAPDDGAWGQSLLHGHAPDPASRHRSRPVILISRPAQLSSRSQLRESWYCGP
jgi:hypothetical protein